MQVVELLHVLLMREHVERDITALPDAIIGITVETGRQAQPSQHGATARIILMAGEGGDDLLCRALLQFLPEADGGFRRVGTNQKVKMIGHQHSADEKESRFLPQLAQRVDKDGAESLASKQAVATIGTRRNELQLPTLEMTPINWHANLSADSGANVSRRAELALRQPASTIYGLNDDMIRDAYSYMTGGIVKCGCKK